MNTILNHIYSFCLDLVLLSIFFTLTLTLRSGCCFSSADFVTYIYLWPTSTYLLLFTHLNGDPFAKLAMHAWALLFFVCSTFQWHRLENSALQWRYKTLCGCHFTNEVTMKIWDMLSLEIRSTLKRVKENPLNHWIKLWKLYSLLCGHFGFWDVGA